MCPARAARVSPGRRACRCRGASGRRGRGRASAFDLMTAAVERLGERPQPALALASRRLAVAVSAGSRRRAIGSGRAWPSCSSTTASTRPCPSSSASIDVEHGADERRHVAADDQDQRRRAPREARPAGPSAGLRRRPGPGRSARPAAGSASASGAATTSTSSTQRPDGVDGVPSSGRPSIGSASLSRPNRLDRPPARTSPVTVGSVIRRHLSPRALAARGRGRPGSGAGSPRRSRSARIAMTYLRLVPVASRNAAGVSGSVAAIASAAVGQRHRRSSRRRPGRVRARRSGRSARARGCRRPGSRRPGRQRPGAAAR